MSRGKGDRPERVVGWVRGRVNRMRVEGGVNEMKWCDDRVVMTDNRLLEKVSWNNNNNNTNNTNNNNNNNNNNNSH